MREGCLDISVLAALVSDPKRPLPTRALAHLTSCSACKSALDKLHLQADRDRGTSTARSWALRTFEGAQSVGSDEETQSAHGGAGLSPRPVASDDVRGFEKIGPYVLLERIGVGGMGTVYAAYHRELDRKVAIKLMRAKDRESQARLLREAQAMARLDHPNVVGVHDIGRHGERVYLVMDLVEGHTLRDWLAAKERGWREILGMFGQAGRGLAAAHAASVVHRDFKPSNVLIGKDQRPRVTDFGLAREADANMDVPEVFSHEPDSDAAQTTDRAGYLSQSLTEVGTILGTPKYMAPEQYVGAGGASSDQFSFCVALYEALYAEPPFEAGVVSELGLASSTSGMASLSALRVREVPKNARVPRFVRRALVRGLSGDPAARFASMADLLVALGKDPIRRAERAGAFVAAAAMLTTIGILSYRMLHPAPAPGCENVGHEWDGVWDSEARKAFHAAFSSASKVADGQAIASAIDEYASTWSAAHRTACERSATAHPDEATTATLTCLDREKTDVEALADVLSHADEKSLADARTTTGTLTPPGRCDDPRVLAALPKPPSDPKARIEAERLRIELARAWATELLDPSKSVPKLEAVVSSVRRIGYRPLEAEALLKLALGQADFGLPTRTVIETLMAADTAAEAGGTAILGAQIAAKLSMIYSYSEKRPALAEEWLTRGRARVERAGGDPFTESRLETAEGSLKRQARDYAGALEHWQRAYELVKHAYGASDPRTLMALFNLASLAEAAGPPGQSETLIKDAIAQIGERLGRRLLYLDLLRDLAQTQAAAGHFREAEASIAESEEISASLDTGPSARSRGESLRAALFHLQGRGVEGLAAARKAVEITEAEGPEASEYKSARALEGVLAEDAGMHALAEERLKPVVDACLSGSLAMPEVDWYLASLAKAYLFSGRASLALPLLERALKDMDSGRPSLGERADIEFGLARTLIELGKDRPRALALAAAAIEELKPYPELMSRLETVQAWVDRMTLLSSKRTER